ncbi:MAG: hypothetical protein QM733_01305 [Ilumatobacteraceae bacterium]
MAQDPLISQQVTLIDQRGSQVVLGDLQMIPVSGGIIWIRPMFSEPNGGSQPLMKFVLASYNGSATFGESIGEAVDKLFPGFDVDLGDRVNVAGEVPGGGDDSGGDNGTGTPSTTTPSTGSSTSVPPTTGAGETPEELLAEANRLFGEADAALQAKDLTGYSSKVDQARQLVQRAFDLMQASTSTTSTSTSAPPGSTVTASGSSVPPTTS